MIRVEVDCYAGYRGNERPLRFKLGERTHEVRSVEDQWYSPGARYFRVVADDENTYILQHDEGQDTWTLDVYRRKEPAREPEHPAPAKRRGKRGPRKTG